MTQYVEMDKNSFLSYLNFHKFIQDVNAYGNELVYKRYSSRNPNVVIKVYTSIAKSGTQRTNGNDSIKVAVVFDNGKRAFGIGKFPPVFRVTDTDSIIDRVHSRILDATKRANEWIDANGPATAAAVETTGKEEAQDAALEKNTTPEVKPLPAEPLDDVPDFMKNLLNPN